MSSSKPLTDLTTTHYEKVLITLNEIKQYLQSIPNSSLYITKLNWVISTITTSSLYNYDFAHQKDLIDKYHKEIPEFKHLIEYLTDFNQQFTLRKNEVIKNTARFVESNPTQNTIEELGLQTPSTNIKRRRKLANISIHKHGFYKKKGIGSQNGNSGKHYTRHKSISFHPQSQQLFEMVKEQKDKYVNCFDFTRNEAKSTLASSKEVVDKGLLQSPSKRSRDKKQNALKHSKTNKTYESLNNININNTKNNSMKSHSNNSDDDSDELANLRPNDGFSNEGIKHLRRKANSFNSPNNLETKTQINKILINNNYDIKTILSIKFNIFELKELVGYSNVMPLIGKVLFDYFNFNDKIINTDKLDSFLFALSSTYQSDVLYHNAIHGADVTQTVSLIIMNSNFEEMAFSNINDILSIITACLGHDLGHPGFNNNFQINSLSDIAITYNDVSVLESFHAASLFKILQKRENNIFENFSDFDFRSLRKRIISQILATDMMNHGKILSVIKTKVNANKNLQGKNNTALIIKDSKNIFQEQEDLFDFIVHASDIAHNAKEFHISLKWVELLSNEFWGQGDKEKELGIPVSFLCDRKDINVPKSQVGFIKAFICPVFELLKDIFPTLDFFLDNANANLNKWNSLVEQKRKTGFSPVNTNRITVNRNVNNSKKNNELIIIQDEETNKSKTIKNSSTIPGFTIKKKKIQGLFKKALVIIN